METNNNIDNLTLAELEYLKKSLTDDCNQSSEILQEKRSKLYNIENEIRSIKQKELIDLNLSNALKLVNTIYQSSEDPDTYIAITNIKAFGFDEYFFNVSYIDVTLNDSIQFKKKFMSLDELGDVLLNISYIDVKLNDSIQFKKKFMSLDELGDVLLNIGLVCNDNFIEFKDTEQFLNVMNQTYNYLTSQFQKI